MRKYIYGAAVSLLVALNTVLFFWRRAGGRSKLAAGKNAAVEAPTPRSATPAEPTKVESTRATIPHSTKPASKTTVVAAPPIDLPRPTVPARRVSQMALPKWLTAIDARYFALALIVFLLTRFIGLDRWPIYFFTDEAIQSVQAANLVQHGFRDAAGNLLPTYFQNGTYYNLSVSVYAQVIPYLLFGFSEIVTRGVSVLVALSGAAAIGLMLRDVFKVRYWWIGTLLLSITPAFFLHSRTAFETIFGTSLYAWFLYFYLRYRLESPSSGGTDRPRHLYWALLFGALAFYAYSPMQAVVVMTGLVLLLSDLRYHWQQRRFALIGVVVLVVLALPYLRFQADHPDESWLHLRTLSSYLVRPEVTTDQRITQFIQQYTQGLSPAYWYSADTGPDLIRHLMKGYGRLLPVTLPFLLIGLIICLRHVKHSAQRAMLLALLATPLGGALANELQVYRLLALTVPAAVLTALGVSATLNRLAKRVPSSQLALGTFVVLSVINGVMFYDALTNGPTWYNDYHMGGLQYGGSQIFERARDMLNAQPDTYVIVSPTWANGTDILLQFFMPDETRVQMGNIDAFKLTQLELNDQMLLVMTPNEYQRTIDDPKFDNVRVEQTLPYPDGSIGFYFVRLNYSAQAEAIFAAEDAARRQPVREEAIIDGQKVSVLHSQFDGGQLRDLFDGDTFTLVRTSVDNPAMIEITFAEPRVLSDLIFTTGTLDFNAKVTLTLDNGESISYDRDYIQTGTDPTNDLLFDPPLIQPVKTLRLEIKDLNIQGDAHIHIREIELK